MNKTSKVWSLAFGMILVALVAWGLGETASKDGNNIRGLLLHNPDDFSTDRWESDGNGSAKVVLGGTPSVTPIVGSFVPVSGTGPQTIITPMPGHVLQVEKLQLRTAPSSATVEFFGGSGVTAIGQAGAVPLDLMQSGQVASAPFGADGHFPILGLGEALYIREQTPIAVSVVNGTTYPRVFYQVRGIEIGTTTPTPVP